MSNLTDRIEVVIGDITTLEVYAVVTAANESLCGGGGVDGAIHRAAGPGLYQECRSIGLCPEGEARITKGHLLPARFIIHTVGPVYEGGGYGEAQTLASCYRDSLKLAESHGVESIAFPNIATGSYGYPNEEACRVAFDTLTEWLSSHDLPRRVILCCFRPEDATPYRERLAKSSAAS